MVPRHAFVGHYSNAPAGKKERIQYTKGESVDDNVYDDDNASISLTPLFNKAWFTKNANMFFLCSS